jgi:hypothetical protein
MRAAHRPGCPTDDAPVDAIADRAVNESLVHEQGTFIASAHDRLDGVFHSETGATGSE